MDWTRREWMAAAGLLPLHASAIADAVQLPGTRPPAGPPPVSFGAPPSLPDKASFAAVRGTYLNGASSHPRSAGSIALMKQAMAAEAGEPGGFRPDEGRLREHFARLINASADEIAFVPSTQIGEAFVAAALGLPEKGAHVVSDHLHFVGSQMMYTDMQRQGLDVTWVKMKDGRIPFEDLDRAIVTGRTRLVAISATAFVNGFQHDLRRVAQAAHAKGAMVYVDAIQAAGNAPIDVRDSGVDALCAATYKWLMSPGTAFLYVRAASQARMRPPFHHWSQASTLPTTHMYPFDAPAAGIVDNYPPKSGAAGMFSMAYSPNVGTLAGLEYSLPYIMNIGVSRIQAHAQALTSHLKTELQRRGYTLLTPVEAASPIVTIAMQNAERLAPVFNTANVRVTTRWNHVRVAVSVFNDMEDVERLLATLPAPDRRSA